MQARGATRHARGAARHARRGRTRACPGPPPLAFGTLSTVPGTGNERTSPTDRCSERDCVCFQLSS
eukprot:9526575-Alexandrium_andersonii.AAC.1